MRVISVAIVLAATPGVPGFASLPECTQPEPAPLLCESKQVNAQSPRDVSPGAPGDDNPAFGYNLVGAHADNSMRLSNIHWHLGAEHYCAGEYDQDYDEGEHRARAAGRRQPNVNEEHESIAPGRMCSVDRLGLTEAQLEPYDFQYCGGVVRVGSTYEMHYVHSSGTAYNRGDDDAANDFAQGFLTDGLSGAFNSSHNAVVQARDAPATGACEAVRRAEVARARCAGPGAGLRAG